MKLTVKQIERLTERGRYGDGHGLYLQVISPTNRSWLLRYERGGRERWMGLGPLHTVPLTTKRLKTGQLIIGAREKALLVKQQLQAGIDPLEARKGERAKQALEAARVITFEEAARQYFAQHERKWKNDKHRAQFLNTLKQYAFSKIGRLAASDVDTAAVLRVLEPMWKEKTETANRVRGRIESVLDWATVRGYRTGDNPARWKGHLAEVLPARASIQKVEHHAALPFTEISTFITDLRKREGTAARALEFTILCASRTGEVIGAQWDEIDIAAKLWTVPAGRIKGGKEHRVPLSEAALAILKGLPTEKNNPYVFIGPRAQRGLSNMAMSSVLLRMERKSITVHGFRSTFRDWAAERTNYPNHIVEMALAHVVGDKVEAAYRRGDLFEKRRKLMADWAKYCDAKPVTAKNVTSIRARA